MGRVSRRVKRCRELHKRRGAKAAVRKLKLDLGIEEIDDSCDITEVKSEFIEDESLDVHNQKILGDLWSVFL